MPKYISMFFLLCLLLVAPLCHAELVGYWSFNKDDIIGDKAIDRSGSGNDGVISGATPVTGKKGQALTFDGSNSCVRVDGLTIEGTQLSVSLWIKKGTLSGVRRLIYFSGNMQFGFAYDTIFYVHTATAMGCDNNQPIGSIGITPGRWHHLVVTWNTAEVSSNVKVYLDGGLKLQGTLLGAEGGEFSIAGLQIGTGNSQTFDGLIDEVAVYDIALTAQEVNKIFKGEIEVDAKQIKGQEIVKPLKTTATFVSPAPVGKKLIRVASELCSRLLDVPSMSEADLPAKVKIWQQTGLDGMVFSMASHDKSKGYHRMTGQWWNLVPRRYEELLPEVEAFQSVKDWGHLTDNFLWSSMTVWGNPVRCQDWFSDEHWEIILANVRLQARVAKECGFKGILLDTEQYRQGLGHWYIPFSYKEYASKAMEKPRTFAECRTMVRKRARQYAETICSQFPNLTLFVIPGLYETVSTAGMSPDDKALADCIVGLYPAFCDGLLLGLNKQASIVAGTEATYLDSRLKKMMLIRNACKVKSLTLSTVPELASKRISFAVGIWADANGQWSDTDVDINQRPPKIHKLAVYNALTASDDYAWLYGEKSKFLTTKPTPLMCEYFQANVDAHHAQDIFKKP